MEWYNKSIKDIFKELNTSENGLSESQINERLDKYGENKLKEEKPKSFIKKIIEQLLDPMVIILIIASIISANIGEVVDSIIIISIVIVNTILSLYQEGKAEEAIKSLQEIASSKSKVIRDGKTIEIDSKLLVPGDIVILETGDIVPADLRLIQSKNLKIDESSLTGESVSVEKNAYETYKDFVDIGDRKNMAFSSTIVSYGRGEGIVIETGIHTQIGQIAESISSIEKESTPLQKKLAVLSKVLGILIIGICLIVLGVGLLKKHEFLEMFMTSISLAVAAVPEGLPAIVTIVLSIGMKRMSQKNAIVKKLLAVETFGTITAICTDKTGTLTQNEMTVKKAYIDGEVIDITGSGYYPSGELKLDGKTINKNDLSDLKILDYVCTLNNDAKLNISRDTANIIGDPTEAALLTFVEKQELKVDDIRKNHKRIEEIPFDSSRKMMTTVNENIIENKFVSLTKGAADIIINFCDRIVINGEVRDLTEDMKQEILEVLKGFSKEALRVLGFAYNIFDTNPNLDLVEKNMIFIGLVGMIDPPRPEAIKAIEECKNAGIIPIMITGDSIDTAVAIGKELKIINNSSQAIPGRELNDMSKEQIAKIVEEKRVFARVSPENKVQIVDALKSDGEIVAMTGDGVNDATAIKRADIGIAMGITGTGVAKNTADVILLDDNFATIVNAVEEGRIIYSNIKKFVGYLLSCNIGEVLIILLSMVFSLPIPLLPIQLLWLNLVTDSFPALALGVEKGEGKIMEKPPRNPNENIIDSELTITLIIQSIAITVATLGAFVIGLKWGGDTKAGIEYARTMAFTTLILAELLRAYSARSLNYTLKEIGIFSNKQLVYATLTSFTLMIIVMYVPHIRELFKLEIMGLKEWIIIIIGALIPLIVGEIQKKIRFKK